MKEEHDSTMMESAVAAARVHLLREVEAARELLEFAVADGRAVSDQLVDKIKQAEGFLLVSILPTPEERAVFERTYRDLAQFLVPVTVQTLRATADVHGRKSFPFACLQPRSEAKIWSRKLWAITGVFMLLALCAENLDRILTQFFPVDEGPQGSVLTWQVIDTVLQSLVPFTYGAIGSLAYLLRSCHEHIYKRQFDPNRIPEYYNRMLLGIVSGGAILLFIEQIATGDGAIKISAAALAFLAGYNTDFLFTTLERVTAAILPKGELETGRRASPSPPPSVSQGTVIESSPSAAFAEHVKILESLVSKLPALMTPK